VISALSERAEFVRVPEGGTEVRMTFSGQTAGLPPPSGADLNGNDWPAQLQGDIVVRLAPVELLAPVLGRIVRGFAARSRFSVDRFAQLAAVTDALSAHAQMSAAKEAIGFAVRARDRHLELTLGPFKSGSYGSSEPSGDLQSACSSLAELTEEVSIEGSADAEVMRVVVTDERHK
jgi:hypothetical protein